MKNRNHAAITIIFTTIWSLSCVTLFPNTAKESATPSTLENSTPLEIIPETTTAPAVTSTFSGQIVYNKGDDIYSINADGTNDTRLAMGKSPTWSPDGTQIAFLADPNPDDDDWGQEIFIMNSDGTNQNPLQLNHPEYDTPANIDWQPNGNLIVFHAYSEVDQEIDFEIFSIDAESKNVVQITRNDGSDWSPSWSPDGRQIVYLSPELNETIHDYDERIHIMNADGTNQTPLTNNWRDMTPAFSPDGRFIAFSSARLDSNGRSSGSMLYIINPDGSNERLLSGDSWASHLAWSPNGQFILFTTTNEEKTSQLFIINTDGSNLTYLTDGADGDWYSSDTGVTTSLPPAQEINQNANCETGVVITSSETPKGQQLDICAFGDKYQIAALAKGSYAVGPNNKFFVYATNGGEVYAVRIGQTNFQKIGSIKDFFRIRNGEIPKLEFTFEEDQSYKVTIRETESNEKQTFAIPNYISAP